MLIEFTIGNFASFRKPVTISLVAAKIRSKNKKTGYGKRQLIFTTHDTHLLNIHTLRRDQIWFIDKDRTAASQLYSLVEFNVRNDDASLEADYVQGRYGAVPHPQIGELLAAYVMDKQ
jgi:AAA15 family ATPase/GTPase